MVNIGVKGDMITAKNNKRISTRNCVHCQLLKHGYRQVVTCDDSNDRATFDPHTPIVNDTNQEAKEPREH